MAEYRPLGSEKLNQDEKLKRILELTYYNNNKKIDKPEKSLVKESDNGGIYAIVKEKDGYYVKRGLNESSLDYIGGLFMKNKNRFSSYAEALKRLELLRGQENLQEATKYVLKQKPKQEAEMPQPSMDMPPAPEGDMPPAADAQMPPAPEGGDMPPAPEGNMPPAPEGEETGPSKKSDYMAEIQKYAGKLGQELRDQIEKLESDDIKYVLNMIISAVDLDKLELEDLEEIGKKFEREEEGMESSEEPPMPPQEEPTPEEPAAEEPEAPEGDLGEYADPMVKLERFIDDSNYDMYEEEFYETYPTEEMGLEEEMHEESDDVVELDMDEINTEIAKNIKETLSKYFR